MDNQEGTVEHTTPKCIQCGKSTVLRIDSHRLARFYARKRNHEYIQDIFPDWTEDQRELLLTGIHPDCWDKMFPEEEE